MELDDVIAQHHITVLPVKDLPGLAVGADGRHSRLVVLPDDPAPPSARTTVNHGEGLGPGGLPTHALAAYCRDFDGIAQIITHLTANPQMGATGLVTVHAGDAHPLFSDVSGRSGAAGP